MLCRSCGKDIPEGTEICPECGEVQEKTAAAEEIREEETPAEEVLEKEISAEEVQPAAEETGTEGSTPEEVIIVPDSKGGKSKKGLITGIVIAVVIIGLILAAKSMLSGSSFSTNEELTEQTVKYIKANDIEGLVSVSSVLTSYGIEGIGYSGGVEEFYGELVDGISEVFDGSLEFDYEIVDDEEISGDELSENIDLLRDEYPDYDWDAVGAIGMTAIELTGENEETTNLGIMSIKEGDNWKLFVLLYY